MKTDTPQSVPQLSIKAMMLMKSAIAKDELLQQLYTQKIKIYSLLMPEVIVNNGKFETVRINEEAHPYISKINEMIDHRMEQIKKSYSK